MGIVCHFCKRNSLPQYQATMPDGILYNFCSSSCVAKFQVSCCVKSLSPWLCIFLCMSVRRSWFLKSETTMQVLIHVRGETWLIQIDKYKFAVCLDLCFEAFQCAGSKSLALSGSVYLFTIFI